MKTIKPNSDVWVINKNEALLFRQTDEVWALESNVALQEFLGSAIALSSFTLADTQVFLNVHKDIDTNLTTLSRCWMGLAQDPLRLLKIPETQQHEQCLRDLRTMGKKVEIIHTQNPQQFLRATPLFLATPEEQQHLKTWLSRQQTGKSNLLGNFSLCAGLWLKPDRAYQRLRAVALACTALTLISTQFFGSKIASQQDAQIHKTIHQTLEQKEWQTPSVSFSKWAEQINKFGRENRANIQALSVHWSTNGQIETFVVLDRERKRVPKGCTITNPMHARCSSQDNTQ